MSSIEIVVNGEPRELPAGSSAQDLLASMGLAERRVAVEVNREIVPRSRYQEHRLASGDQVEVVQAIGGG